MIQGRPRPQGHRKKATIFSPLSVTASPSPLPASSVLPVEGEASVYFLVASTSFLHQLSFLLLNILPSSYPFLLN